MNGSRSPRVRRGELEPKVFDAEFVDDQDPGELLTATAGRTVQPVVWRLCRSLFAVVVPVAGRAWQSPTGQRVRSVAAYRLRKAPADVLRLVWFVVRGHGRWIGKAWTWATYADLRADARAARIAGDREARREAQELIRADARARWAGRRMPCTGWRSEPS